MKNNFLKSIVFFGITCVFIVSCKKKIDDAYLNPNASTRVPIESILPGVIGGFTAFFSSAGTSFGVQADGILLGRYIQYYGSTTNGENYGEMGGVTTNSVNTAQLWGTVYFGQGLNVNKIIEWGTEEQKWDYVGAAQAIRAWGWLELTNQYGDAILKEAFNTSLSQFHYDTQPEFYDSCRALCFRALENLSRTDGNVSQANFAIGDAYFFKGDVNKWKKFVYGILARSYIDLSSKNIFTTNHYADLAIKYANLSMTTNEDNATVKVSGGLTSAVNNYYGPFRGNIGSIRQSAYVARLMSGSNSSAFVGVSDPRRWYMLSENLNGTFKGFTPWLGETEYLSGSTPTNDYPKNFWRNPSPRLIVGGTPDSSRYVYQNTSPWPMMTASEMQFILAEAYLRKGDPLSKDSALAAYKNAIGLNFDMLTSTYNQNIPVGKDLNILANSKNIFLSNPVVAPTSSSNLTLTHIMLQKYIALYAWGVHQTWVDMRKYHYTDIDPATGKQVYADFTPPPTSPTNYLVTTNNGKLVYRCRPRYTSEYQYDIPELTRIGALNLDYNTYEMWFSMK